MDGLELRGLTLADAPGVVDLELAAEAAEPAGQATDLSEWLEEFQNPGVDLSRGSVAAEIDGRMVGFGMISAPTTPTDRWHPNLWVTVDPAYRRQGIGRAVLDRLIEQAKARHAREWPGLPAEVQLWLARSRASAVAFGPAVGFEPRRYFFDMEAELADRPIRSEILPGLEVRTWTPADDESVRSAYNSSFADHWGSTPSNPERWRKLFAESAFFRPEYSRLALLDGDVVGFVLVAEFESERLARGYRVGYVDRVGTVRSARGRGVASALLAGSMRLLTEAGFRVAELGVDGESPTGAGRIYERLGFRVVRRNDVVGLRI